MYWINLFSRTKNHFNDGFISYPIKWVAYKAKHNIKDSNDTFI
jgi:hypothetical protein